MKKLWDIPIDRIEDDTVKEGMEVLRDTLTSEPLLLSGFQFIQLTFTTTGTFVVAHGLGQKPLDVIPTGVTGSGTVTWNYNSFDNTNLNLTIGGTVTTTQPTLVRAFIGAYRKDA